VIFEVQDSSGGTIGWLADRKAAEAEAARQRELGDRAIVRPFRYTNTREGIAALLTAYAGGAGRDDNPNRR
jgi:hypothetical protein